MTVVAVVDFFSKMDETSVPQGSVLGPLLFAIIISDIDLGVLTSSILSYADDTKIFKVINELADVDLLQEDLASLYAWSVSNNQDFNAGKFEAMSYSTTRHKNLYFTPNDAPIQSKDHVKDLGITFSFDASFGRHIDIITAKARKLSGWMLRTFRSRARDLMLTLLRQLIIPTIEYCSPVWSPKDNVNIDKLERIQRSFTKRIHGLDKTHYWDRLINLHLFSLQRRRERYMILYIWKIIHGIVPDIGLKYAASNTNEAIKLQLPRLAGPAHASRLFERSILYHGVRLYNALPAALRKPIAHGETADAEAFKRQLDKFLSAVPDQPGPPKGGKCRQAETNSIIHQVNFQREQTQGLSAHTVRKRRSR